ncbi:MAG: hypothetical protein Q8912_12830 [Bacillota bacterium]|nr:hypothetical protein [Bacillota bacterium]MDP4160543.1 hypothetical protein [Bacillota bacterium]
MRWWYGVLANGLFWTSLWAVSTKYLTQSQQYWLQILVLPLSYFLNVWYGKSVAIAGSNNIPFFMLTLFSVSLNALLSFTFSTVLLQQRVTMTEIAGGFIVIVGLIIMKL